MHYDVFNGDADGIISLLQLRLAQPKEAQLVTGVKRDIQLLDKLTVKAGDSLTVLDISLQKNRIGLLAALDAGADVFYADHHQAGDIPSHSQLSTHINLDSNMCTALIIDQLLEGRFREWAITAAYGDNLNRVADELCKQLGLTSQESELLKELGTLINYNGYGKSTDQLHFHPEKLYQILLAYPSPFEVIRDTASPFYQLKAAYEADVAQAISVSSFYESETLRVFELPDEVFSHRVSGVYGNLIANQSPSQAHLVLTKIDNDNFAVSLRAPLNNKQGAGELCSQFVTGGGREAAGGINRLPEMELSRLVHTVESYYGN
ncbi:DHH family phosphoesterase [Vibrio diazotrophicus]|uniref:DHH family phosphoesterase n=1 Tax=Vibrio diazotrophicus TaxID=685 RepID=UPI00142E435F|nr:DHH family phosphoesterase [Vibrio diazotrophicus]NIY93881.1 DHH family phosphoesterase [Vibrio diazotrophicus]